MAGTVAYRALGRNWRQGDSTVTRALLARSSQWPVRCIVHGSSEPAADLRENGHLFKYAGRRTPHELAQALEMSRATISAPKDGRSSSRLRLGVPAAIKQAKA
jgi:hypothetical protein